MLIFEKSFYSSFFNIHFSEIFLQQSANLCEHITAWLQSVKVLQNLFCLQWEAEMGLKKMSSNFWSFNFRLIFNTSCKPSLIVLGISQWLKIISNQFFWQYLHIIQVLIAFILHKYFVQINFLDAFFKFKRKVPWDYARTVSFSGAKTSSSA